VTVWGSNVNDFFNFDLGKSRDDNGIDATLDVGQFDAITGTVSNRVLQIFTGGAEFVVTKSPITPENQAFRRQESYGSRFIEPRTLDNATFYIQRTGRALREFILGELEQEYRSDTTSVLAPVLLRDPVDMDVSIGTDLEDANYVYVINTDGTAAAFNTLRSQEVSAWTSLSTNGAYRHITQVVDSLYTSIEREGKFNLERIDTDSNLDASTHYALTGTNILAGLEHLEGQEVAVIADGSLLQNKVVAGGQITLERDVQATAEVGLAFFATVKTMPIEANIGAGYDFDSSKRMVKTTVWLQNTATINIGSFTVPFKTFGTERLDQPITLFTGKKSMQLMGYDKTMQLDITQDTPTPFMLLGLSIEMELS